jgi:predicted HNH restriction endonuclease
MAKKAVRGLRFDDVRDKRIIVLKTDFKRGESAIRYAEMVDFVRRRGGKATVSDMIENTSYHMDDLRWDLLPERGHIRLADAVDFGPHDARKTRYETDTPLNSQIELQQALLVEGELSQRMIQVRSRSHSLRELCIERHGSRCFVCSLDFGERFGEMFAGLIEVHHKKPLSMFEQSAKTDPEADCIPLCPNCHRMAHFGLPPGKCRSLDELQELFARSEQMVKA